MVHGVDDHGYAWPDNGDSDEGPVTVFRCREIPKCMALNGAHGQLEEEALL